MIQKLELKNTNKQLIKNFISIFIGFIVSKIMRAYKWYEMRNDSSYSFRSDRLYPHQVTNLYKYFHSYAENYKHEQLNSGDIEKTSQYFHFKTLDEAGVGNNVTICNIGCFYCVSEKHFLNKHKNAFIYGMDFGNVEELNKDIADPRLKIIEGYPLLSLEKMVKEGKKDIFDYAFFTRTATMINIEQLRSYMRALKVLSKSVCFLEVMKILLIPMKKVAVEEIDVNNPVRMYEGMYIHNYPALLKEYGYQVTQKELLGPKSFTQWVTSDHYFIHVVGKREI